MFLDAWRAPRWMPKFIRLRFLGVWTQEEVDRIWERAGRDAEQIRRFVDERQEEQSDE